MLQCYEIFARWSWFNLKYPILWKILYRFRIGDTLFNENLGYDSNWNMKTSLNLQTAISNFVTEITYLSGGGAVCKIKLLLGNFFDLLNSLGSFSFGLLAQTLLLSVLPLVSFSNLSYIIFGLNSYHVGVLYVWIITSNHNLCKYIIS